MKVRFSSSLLLWGLTTTLFFPACSPLPPSFDGVAPSGTSAPGVTPVRLASWNVRNLFDAVDDPYEDEVPTPAEVRGKLVDLAAVVTVLDADFLALQEVENLDSLRALNGTLGKPYPQVGLIEGNDRMRGIDVAFLSRLPVRKVTSHANYDLPNRYGVSRGYRFSRDCLEVTLDTNPPVVVLVNHFKSQLGGSKDSASKRRVQAEAVVAIASSIATANPTAVELIMGDLNDVPGSWCLEPLAGAFTDAFAGWPKKLRGTHRSSGHGSSGLDHIWVNSHAQGRLEKARIWQDAGEMTSDHDPVSVVLRLDSAPHHGAATARVWRGDPPLDMPGPSRAPRTPARRAGKPR